MHLVYRSVKERLTSGDNWAIRNHSFSNQRIYPGTQWVNFFLFQGVLRTRVVARLPVWYAGDWHNGCDTDERHLIGQAVSGNKWNKRNGGNT
jgi:hypothetical protein